MATDSLKNRSAAVQDCTSDLDWENLRVLAALERHGSLSAAARALSINHATVSRRIAILESSLGHPLFERAKGRYVITPQGLPIARLARSMEESALSIRRMASGLNPEIAGTVRITATEGIGTYLLTPILGQLAAAYPTLDIDLITTDSNLSLVHHEADLALRFGLPTSGNIVGRRMANIIYHFYASEAYLAAHTGKPYSVIVGPSVSSGTREFQRFNQAIMTHNIVMRSNSLISRMIAAQRGLGATALPRFVAEQAGGLVVAPIDNGSITRDLFLLTHRDVKNVPRMRVVSDYIFDAISGMRRQLE